MRLRIKKLLCVLLGTLIIAVSLNMFLVPANIVPGGISGLAIIVNRVTGIPLGLLILVFNIPVFIWGLKHFSRRFILFSLAGMFFLSAFTDIFSFIRPVTGDIMLSAVYGGALMGFGIGLVFWAECTTGGTDIAARILKKQYPFISVGRFVLIIDAFIVFLAGLVFGKWEVILYSAIVLYISSFLIDLITEGGDFAKVAYIISDKQEQISNAISNQLERGVTVLHGSSLYSGKKKAVLLCVVKKYEIAKLKRIIKETDSCAFVIVSDAREVLGNGFKSH